MAVSTSPVLLLKVLDLEGEENSLLLTPSLSSPTSSTLLGVLRDPRFKLLLFAFSIKEARSASFCMILSKRESITSCLKRS